MGKVKENIINGLPGTSRSTVKEIGGNFHLDLMQEAYRKVAFRLPVSANYYKKILKIRFI